jgi:hypothetical protein
MNWILFCSKDNKKRLESNIEKPDNLLATIIQTPENDINYAEILEKYNPHGVVISDFGVETALEIRKIRSATTKFVILFLTDITLENVDLIKNLYANSVYVSDKLELQNIPKPSKIHERIFGIKSRRGKAKTSGVNRKRKRK